MSFQEKNSHHYLFLMDISSISTPGHSNKKYLCRLFTVDSKPYQSFAHKMSLTRRLVELSLLMIFYRKIKSFLLNIYLIILFPRYETLLFPITDLPIFK